MKAATSKRKKVPSKWSHQMITYRHFAVIKMDADGEFHVHGNEFCNTSDLKLMCCEISCFLNGSINKPKWLNDLDSINESTLISADGVKIEAVCTATSNKPKMIALLMSTPAFSSQSVRLS